MRIDAASNIARIVEAARTVFAAGDGTGSLTQIAKRAGVGPATLYRHFPNREALARAVFDRIFTSELEPLLVEFGRPGTSHASLLGVVEQIDAIVQRERGLIDSLGSARDMGATIAGVLRDHAHQLGPHLANAQDAGTIRADVTLEDLPSLIASVAVALTALDLPADARGRCNRILLDAFSPQLPRP